MSIEWTQALATGVDVIDDQHKELFGRVNRLFDACKEGKGRTEIGGLIDFLEGYVITHFSTEEKFMDEYDYPGFSAHKSHHAKFIKTFSELKDDLRKDGAALPLVVKANGTVVDWLNNHIRKIDVEMGAFLRTRLK
jgi:hemerythrin